MKKSFISLGLIVAATFALTNCTKDIENPSDKPETAGIPFELTASTPDTKTTNDGLATEWAAGDQISVFHAITGTEEYVQDATNETPFVITSENLASNKFTGTLAEELDGESYYDWYVMYPFHKSWKPNTTGGGIVYMGSKYNEVQTQNGNDNTSHLAGKNVPFAGKAKNVAASSVPTIALEHLASVIEVTVNNTSGEDLTVSSVTFTATEPIIGGYYISIAGSEPVYTANGIYVNETATLTVTDADAIASGYSAKYYLAIKPFTATSGSQLKISVNGYEKAINLPKDVSFVAGKIKPLTFKYDKVVGQSIPYSEAFNNTQGLFTIEDKTLPAELTYVWKTNSGYIKASAYKSSTNYASESWLISPYLDLSDVTSAYLSFEHCGNYFTDVATMQDELKVKVRKHGGEWNDLSVTYPESLGWDFVHSGFVSLSSYVGNNVQVAFVYTSTDAKAGTWEVKNFKVAPKKDQIISFSSTSVGAETGSDFIEPVLNGVMTTATYTSSNTSVATVDPNTGEVTLLATGNTTITATATESSEYYGGATATYALTVTAPITGDEKYYVKVTSAPADWSGEYLIVYEKSASEAFVFTSVDEAENYLTVAITGNGILSSEGVDAELVTLEKMEGGYAVKTKNDKYLYATAGNYNSLKFSNSVSLNTISLTADDNIEIASNDIKLAFFDSGSNSRFRYYGKSTQKPIQLYKLGE